MTRPFRIASYNVHGWIGTDRVYAPERCLSVLDEIDADVVGMQEVTVFRSPADRPTRAAHSHLSFTEHQLTQRTGMTAILGPTLQRVDTSYGNVLLTRNPVLAVRRHDLSLPGREPRGALDVDLWVDQYPLRVIVTHLGLRASERRIQARQLAAILDSRPGDVVLMGDFNQWLPPPIPRGALAPLIRRMGATPLRRTFPARFPLLPLDCIWFSSRQGLDSSAAHRSALARVASDHLPVRALLRRGPSARIGG